MLRDLLSSDSSREEGGIEEAERKKETKDTAGRSRGIEQRKEGWNSGKE
jgi:hypothetical protein